MHFLIVHLLLSNNILNESGEIVFKPNRLSSLATGPLRFNGLLGHPLTKGCGSTAGSVAGHSVGLTTVLGLVKKTALVAVPVLALNEMCYREWNFLQSSRR